LIEDDRPSADELARLKRLIEQYEEDASMNAPASALEPAARIAIAALLGSLWVAALAGFAAWGVFKIVPGVNAAMRYAGWSLALARRGNVVRALYLFYRSNAMKMPFGGLREAAHPHLLGVRGL
jgi:hypothetical protein